MPKRTPNRILMLLENFPYPGDGRVREEALGLAACGYRIVVISPKGKGQPWREVVDGVKTYRFPQPDGPGGVLGYLWEYGYSLTVMFALSLLTWVVDGFDIIHAAQPPDALALIAAFYKMFGKRYVLDHHDLSPELYYYARFGRRGNPAVYRALLAVEAFSFRVADRVISTNDSYRQIAIERGRVDPARVAVVRNGPENDLPREARESIVPKDGRLLVGYLGVIGVQDGVDNLVRAAYHLRHDLGRQDFLCVIVGSGNALRSVKTLARELGVEEYVRFTGWVSGQELVSRYLDSMDICVAPEPSDPYNERSTAVKVMEYMAAGKPIVSSDLPEHRVTAGEAAIFARAGDPLDVARKICQLMDDPAQRERMGQAGRRRIKAELDWPIQARKLVELYDGLTGWQRSETAAG